MPPAPATARRLPAADYPRLKGHDPLAQEPALAQPPGGSLVAPAWAAKVEKALSVLPEPHCSHLCEPFVPAFSRKLVTCPHWRHLYSNSGIHSLLVVAEAFYHNSYHNTCHDNSNNSPAGREGAFSRMHIPWPRRRERQW
jgi:hypothetical protein